MGSLNQRNTLVVTIGVAFSFVAAVALGIVGNTLATQSAERVSIADDHALVVCAQSGHSVMECRNLVYGTR